jgi:hypothetical protein
MSATVRPVPVSLQRLWLGVLAAPVAWLILELLGYYLASRGCDPALGVPLAGPRRPAVVQVIVCVVGLGAALYGLLVAIGNWRAVQPQPSSNDDATADLERQAAWGRAHFMAFSGILASGLFGLGIVLFALPPFFINACSQAR